MTAVAYSSFPSIVEGRIVHDVMAPKRDGGWDPILQYKGIYNNVRDNEFVAYICALPLMIDAGRHVIEVIDGMNDRHGRSAITEDTYNRLLVWTGMAEMTFAETVHALAAFPSRQDEIVLFLKLEDAVDSLFDALCPVSDVIQHAIQRFNDPNSGYDAKRVAHAIYLAEWPDFQFKGDAYARFETWLISGAGHRVEGTAVSVKPQVAE